MKNGTNRTLAGKLANGASWAAAFLTALLLAVLAVELPVRHILSSRDLNECIALNPQLLQLQEERMNREIAVLSARYGFHRGRVASLVTTDRLTEQNRDAVAWWVRIMEDGTVNEAPRWDTQALRQTLAEDTSFTENRTPEEIEKITDLIEKKLLRVMERSVLPMRQELVSWGMKEVRERADVAGLLHLVYGLPTVLALLCLLLTGITALLQSRKIAETLRYAGAACGAAGIFCIGAVCVWKLLNLQALTAESSEILTLQVKLLESAAAPQAAVEIVLLFAAALLCRFALRRSGRQPGQRGKEA